MNELHVFREFLLDFRVKKRVTDGHTDGPTNGRTYGGTDPHKDCEDASINDFTSMLRFKIYVASMKQYALCCKYEVVCRSMLQVLNCMLHMHQCIIKKLVSL